ncbi:MAG: VCBS repeat-containing protein [Acidobacteria bacterium]|nr:VCBS repeat-containing protein [Acidobacteriota bacterium]
MHKHVFRGFAVMGSLVMAWVGGIPLGAQVSGEIPFRKHVLDLGSNETCAVADLNADGRLDIVSGENWYEAPSWRKHRFRSFPTINNYIDNFSDLPLDVDGDGRIDLISVSYMSRKMTWFHNPGKPGGDWPEAVIDSGAPVEFALLVDIDNDGRASELLPQFGGAENGTAWYEVIGKPGSHSWVKHQVAEKSFGHGIGAGDVDGDGRNDILTPKGWLKAPEDPRIGAWEYRAEYDTEERAGFLYVHDVNADGINDIVTSMAHDYGIFWLEQASSKSAAQRWTKHLIDDAWSQAHAMTMVDLTGDGHPELVSGKRLFAHNGHDKGGREVLGLYWYEQTPPETGSWVRHIIHYGGRVGAGMQIPVVDLDGDGDRDVVVAGKGGVFLFENLSSDQQKSPERR